MAKAPAFQFYVRDWLADPQLRLCSASTRGIWIDLLCFMWESPDRGILSGRKIMLAGMAGATEVEFDLFLREAAKYKFCDSVTDENGFVTLLNRRMAKEAKAKKQAATRQARFRGKHQK